MSFRTLKSTFLRTDLTYYIYSPFIHPGRTSTRAHIIRFTGAKGSMAVLSSYSAAKTEMRMMYANTNMRLVLTNQLLKEQEV